MKFYILILAMLFASSNVKARTISVTFTFHIGSCDYAVSVAVDDHTLSGWGAISANCGGGWRRRYFQVDHLTLSQSIAYYNGEDIEGGNGGSGSSGGDVPIEVDSTDLSNFTDENGNPDPVDTDVLEQIVSGMSNTPAVITEE